MLDFPEDRYLGPDAAQKEIALQLYRTVTQFPILSPHGHVDPRLFADPDYSFGTPVDLFIIPDHYVFRMLYSQGIHLRALGIPRKDGKPSHGAAERGGDGKPSHGAAERGGDGKPVEKDHRAIWQKFAENFYLFRGTPSGVWITGELYDIFGVRQKLNGATAQEIYDQVAGQLALPEFRPRKLFEHFNIEVLCTTDAATDPLEYHAAIRKSGWPGRILPTFRPDQVVNLETPGWRDYIEKLSQASGINVHDYKSFIQALENRRAFFKEMGAKATDHAAITPYTESLTAGEVSSLFQRALRGETSAEDARQFMGHMLMEMARMSVDDGLVMQIHPGSFRNHNTRLFEAYGPDMGADIPVQTEFTRNLRPLLDRFGNNRNFTLILFTLDETSYSRELAPLAGHYPALKLGPPWWFYDSLNGIQRYFEGVIETAGLYNTAGFNDDTRAFCSIPARHDLWRRASANWVAGLVARKIVDMDDASEMIIDLSYRIAKKAYKL